MLKLFNSLTAKKEEFKSIKPGEVSIYTCGPTVYNFAHVGNFRAYLAADTLRRFLIFSGYMVKWVMNITDVDDKTIRDSKLKYPDLNPMEALNKFCRYYEEKFFEDLEKLGINKSDFYANPRATEYIEAQQNLVNNIFKAGYAYEVGGSIYFDVKKYNNEKGYGRLVNIDFDSMQSTTRVENDEYEKEEVADFVLWKGIKEGEPFWEFNFNGKDLPGRPGWHLECSAMEKEILGLPFDIHNGGKDLKFPHHEDEIAQSYAGYGLIPNNYFIHNGYLLVDSEKMSKSKGNFYVLSDLIEKGHSPELIRFSLVINHYLIDFNLTENGFNSAKKNLEYIRIFYSEMIEIGNGDNDKGTIKIINKYKKEFIDAMNDDLNVPKAIAGILEFIKDVRKHGKVDGEQVISFLDSISFVFGVSFSPTANIIPKEIIDLADKRLNAKINKDFALADRLRQEIEEKGYSLKDEKGGYKINKI